MRPDTANTCKVMRRPNRAAWTPDAGLVVAYMGDTLPVLLQTTDSGEFEGRTLGMPHRNYYGAITPFRFFAISDRYCAPGSTVVR